MKRAWFIVICLLLIIPFAGISQDVNVFDDDENSKSFFGVNAGFSFPAGNYSSVNSGSTGFALPGPGASAEGAIFFSKFFGAGLRLDYNRHFVADNKIVEINAQTIPENAVYDVKSSGMYEIASLMTGLYTSMSINNWLQINGKALYGPHLARIPEFEISYYREYEFNGQDIVDDWTELHEAAGDWQFGYLVGFGVRLNPSRSWAFNISLDYAESYQEIEYISNESGVIHDEIGTAYYGAGVTTGFFDQKFRYMLLTGGLSIFL